MLIASSSASGTSAIHHLDIRFILRTPQEYIFTFHKLYKSWEKSAFPRRLVFHEYAEDSELCVVMQLMII